MITCRICGEDKPREDFLSVPNFTKYKKHKVYWCRVCQKLWLDFRKTKQRQKEFQFDIQKFTVSFE